MPRKVPEWIGKTPDTNPPNSVKLRVFGRYGGVCQVSGQKIQPGDRWDADHITPLWDGGENRENNLQPVLVQFHKQKSAEEAAQRAEAKRHRAKHSGLVKRKKPGGFQTNRDGKWKAIIGGKVERR